MSHGEYRSTGRVTDAGRPPSGVAYAAPYTPPRLTITRRTPAAPSLVSPAERDQFLDLVLGGNDAAVGEFIDDLTGRGVGAGAVYMELLAPTAEALGTMWENDTCDFVDVTLAVGRLQRAVRELGHGFVGAAPPGAAVGRVLLSALPGEQHTLGLFMVAEYLLRDGWQVRVLTPDTPADLAGAVRDGWYDVVGFSAACDSRLLALRHEIALVRRHSRNSLVSVVVGGRIFVEHPELVGRVGADASAATAADASGCARALLGARPG